jgi:prephenate dehydratase
MNKSLAMVCGFFILGCSACAGELFRDQHEGRIFRFESNQAEVQATATQAEIVAVANAWAPDFYGFDTLESIDSELKTTPIRFWLVTFRDKENKETFYAVLLPNGTIVEPSTDDKM